jgi:hypothetical protein
MLRSIPQITMASSNRIADSRAPYHEAGHALVARKLGIPLLGVGFVEGAPGKLATGVVNQSDLNNPIFCAGGMAAEEILFGKFNPEGSVSDRELIGKTGASVAESVRAARELLQRDEILSIGKRIETFAIQNNSGSIPEKNLFT